MAILKYLNIKVLVFANIFVLLVFYLCFSFGFNKNELFELESIICGALLLRSITLFGYRKEYFLQGYISFKWSKIYTWIMVFFSCLLFILLQISFNINNLENQEKDKIFSGRIVYGDTMYYSYDNNGKALKRLKPLKSSRYAPPSAGFLFLVDKHEKQIGFISCSVFKGDCFEYWNKIPKEEYIDIAYQKIDGINADFFILTGLKSKEISVDRVQLIQQYRHELLVYQVFLLLLVLLNIVFFFWNKWLYHHINIRL